MTRLRHCMCAAALAALTLCALPQPLAAQVGQVVQLPTFHQFSISTTVVVPDGGTTAIGGIDYAREARAEREAGVFAPLSRSRGAGREMGGSRASVRAGIHDFAAYDRRLLHADLNASPPSLVLRGAPTARAATAPAVEDPGRFSVAEITRRRAQQQDLARQQLLREARQFIQRGDQAAAAGQPAAARLCYQMAEAKRVQSEKLK